MKELRIYTQGERQSSDYPPEPDPVVSDDVELLELIGQGKRSQVWRVRLDGEAAALKVYRQAQVEKFRKRYGLDIAEFEFERNTRFRSVPGLERYCAEPLAVFGLESGVSPAFAQSLVSGPRLTEVATAEGCCPPELLAIGYRIVELAAEAGLHDLDINSGNIRLRRTAAGWSPILHDFNLVPQHIHAPNPWRALAIRWGIRDRSIRDYHTLEQWKRLGLPPKKLADVH